MWLLLDNYDSFTYNLAQYMAELGVEPLVVRNDAITLREVEELNPEAVLVSPGPGRPENSGICLPLIGALGGRTPILGICLGHQAIAAAYGGRVVGAPTLMHGKVSPIFHRGHRLFRGVENPFSATRYHSLLVERRSLPDELEVIAETDDGLVMAIAHRRHPVYGVQFHPESILTKDGKTILANFIDLVRDFSNRHFSN
ncbi:MAG TPA: aminodeoxychorismate/anthranilate synthase component II [Firmicutes bacterium]|nr:aminodeoxychorismate/anthranilate synthase component II [Bacillota bacterium]